MNFEKTSISPKVRKFLQDNLKDAKDKESLLNIISEKPLLKNDAINLLIIIFIIIIRGGVFAKGFAPYMGFVKGMGWRGWGVVEG